ncbi:WecB/TagA/CpsF family glycosyltransferase [Collinsella tanakaei]|nr:WecB/TagA/CpsF family glycosyltransferase [Collinsella tanakaei]
MQGRYVSPKRRAILDTYVNDLTMDETVAEVERIVDAGVPTQHVVINASKVNLMEDDSELREIVNACPLINADGASIVWAARVLGVPLRERVTGIDLFLRLVELAPRKGWGIYLFGAKEEVVQKARSIFEERCPGIRIAGCRNGYFTEADEPGIVADMAASGADIMFVAFSSPKKEYWVHKYLDRIGIPFVMGVGGSFDVVAGVTDRAPAWMQKCGLEWLYRFLQEPRRLWRRYVVGNARFVSIVLGRKFLRKDDPQWSTS